MYTCLRQGNDFYVVLNYGKLQRIHSTGGMPIFHLPPFKCAHLYQICIQHTQMSKMYGIFQCSFYYNKNYYDRTQFYFKIKYKYKSKKLFLRLICFFSFVDYIPTLSYCYSPFPFQVGSKESKLLHNLAHKYFYRICLLLIQHYTIYFLLKSYL